MGSDQIFYSRSIVTPCALPHPKRPFLLKIPDINADPGVQNNDNMKHVIPAMPL